MRESIIEKVESLSPLPKTITQIDEFRQKENKETEDLLHIVEKDALIVSTLLKVSNSAMFGFRSKVETVKRAVELLGINFTISIAISSTINNLLKCDLSTYFINTDDFMRASNLSSSLTSLWLPNELKEELVLPALLQETGKFVIAEIISSNEDVEEFKKEIRLEKNIEIVEKKYVGMSTSEVTAAIFKHWKLSDNLVNLIEFVDKVEECKDPRIIVKVKILNVVKTICNVSDPLNEENIKKGLEKAKAYGLDTDSLQKAINKLQDRILDEL